MKHSLSLATLAALIGAGAGSLATSAASSPPANDRGSGLTLTAGGLTAYPQLEAQCPGGSQLGACTARPYNPRPPGHLPIKSRQRLTITTDAAASRVLVKFAHPNRAQTRSITVATRAARSVSSSHQTWDFTAPANIAGVRYLLIDVEYANGGSADYRLGVRTSPACS